MDDRTHPQKRHHHFIIAIVAIVLISLLRAHTFHEPLDADEALYSIIAKDWTEGGKPYITLWDNKPIGTFITYRIAIWLFGYVETAPKIMATIFIAVATLLISWSLWDQKISWFGAALLLIIWSFMSCLVTCQANGANSEVFLIPFLVGSYLLMRMYCQTRKERYFWLTYFVLTASLLIKQVTLPYFVIPFLLLTKRQWRNPGTLALRLGGIVLLTVVGHVSVYSMLGYSPTLLVEQLMENAIHVTKDAENSIMKFLKTALLFPFSASIRPIIPLTLLTIFGTMWACIAHPKPTNLILLYFLVATAVAVALPGDNFPHYYILLLPIIVFSLGVVCTRFRLGWQISVLGLCVIIQVPYVCNAYLLKHPHEISYAKFGNNNWFVRDRFIGRKLVKVVTNNRIFVDGSHPGIFFYSRNRPATKYVVAWNYFAMGVTSWDNVFTELKSAPPAACVLLNPLVPPFKTWVENNYTQQPSIAGSQIFTRKPIAKLSSD